MIQQYMNIGLIDEFIVSLAPVFLVTGVRLFDHIEKLTFIPEIADFINSPMVTYLKYNVRKK